MPITYKTSTRISPDAFIDLLRRSTLAERRPVNDVACITGMLENSNLLITAWDEELLVGAARSVTDFHYCCYLSDLAVDKAYQNAGIGRALQDLTRRQLGPLCKLILISAPAANEYYPRLGYANQPRCWVLEPDQPLGC